MKIFCDQWREKRHNEQVVPVDHHEGKRDAKQRQRPRPIDAALKCRVSCNFHQATPNRRLGFSTRIFRRALSDGAQRSSKLTNSPVSRSEYEICGQSEPHTALSGARSTIAFATGSTNS